jgi:hypothetical protein
MARKNLTGVGKLLDQIAKDALENFRKEQGVIHSKIEEEVEKAMGISDLVERIEKLTGHRICVSFHEGSLADKEMAKRLEQAGYVRMTGYCDEPAGLAELKLNWQIRMLSIETGEDVGKYVNSFRKEMSELLHAWKP